MQEAGSLSEATIDRLNKWWLTFLGATDIQFGEAPLVVVRHPGPPRLGNWRGLYVLKRKGTTILSAPSGYVEPVFHAFDDVEDLAAADMWSVLSKFGARIGPALIGYRDVAVPPRGGDHSVDVAPDDPLVPHLKAKCPRVEWDEAGIETATTLRGIVENGRLIALAGYELFEGSDSGIAQLGVIVSPESRGRELGIAVLSDVANRAIEANLVPQYRASLANVASLRMAEKLGFVHFAEQGAVRLI